MVFRRSLGCLGGVLKKVTELSSKLGPRNPFSSNFIVKLYRRRFVHQSIVPAANNDGMSLTPRDDASYAHLLAEAQRIVDEADARREEEERRHEEERRRERHAERMRKARQEKRTDTAELKMMLLHFNAKLDAIETELKRILESKVKRTPPLRPAAAFCTPPRVPQARSRDTSPDNSPAPQMVRVTKTTVETSPIKSLGKFPTNAEDLFAEICNYY